MNQKIYITTAIDYVNSVPHVGTAYEKIGADVLARFFRLRGFDVRFQMGNDEHSVNVQKSAKEKGLDPKAYCDQMRPQFEEVWKRLNISNDQFIQTSEQRHHKAVSALFQKIYDAGDIYPKEYEGWYCESCEAFYTEKDLEEGLCPNHKKKPKWLQETNYFFKLSKYADFLLKHIQDNPHFIVPEKRRNEVLQFIKGGLEDVSVSRSSFDWGIPLPIEKDHVVYVWFDALINYITGIGFGSDDKLFSEWWDNRVLHVIGKDITRFHCIIWPAMLQSAGVALPDQILGHGFVYLKGEKMSKSLGNVVTPLDIINKYPEFGVDALRYYLMRGSSFGDDGDFTWDGFIERYNSDLANGFGNLVSRSLGMVNRYQSGELAPLTTEALSHAVLKNAASAGEKIIALLDPQNKPEVAFHSALEEINAYIKEIDQYIDQTAPWTLAKEGKSAELSVFLTTAFEAIRNVSVLLFAFIPGSVQKVWEGLGFESIQKLDSISYSDLSNLPFIKSTHKIPSDKMALFPRIQAPKEEPEAKQVPVQSKEDDKLISIEDFLKVDLRVAEVLQAEKVEGADKLLKLQIALGDEKRQIIAGVAEHYTPEEMLGKSVIVVANLKPATIRGIESNGMLLAAKKGKKKFSLIGPIAEMPSNAKVG
ncbi:MAG: methionine--tRNA ligase [Deltaproteobacteria bacterium]|nr:methionine--tRNA ligase [Deltaproteobacteria bacterium]